MGSDLQLTGLASGFDWKPVVEQLIALESIPKSRLENEKKENNSKVSDLGLLKSQLDSLNSASKALQNGDLFNARKIAMDSDSSKILSASASAGALTGSYKVSLHSIGSQTEMSSSNRAFGGLGGNLGAGGSVTTKLSDLPLQTPITTGTFTIAGKTLSIDNLSKTLDDVLADINAVLNGVTGVNPEGDGTGITFEYEDSSDKIIVDGGDFTTQNAGLDGVLNTDDDLPALPVLGSPTDTSNFLQVLRLLNRETHHRDADLEAGSGISVFTTGAALTDGPKLSWLRQDDNEESLTSADSQIYAAFNNVVYKRVASEPKYAIGAGTDHVAGHKVYRNGFVYEMKAGKTLAGLGAWNVASPSTNAGDTLKEGVEHFKLLTTISSHSDYKGNFSDAGFHNTATTKFDPEGVAGAAIAAGDIVQGSAGNFFRAVVDRGVGTTVDWDELPTDFAGANGIAATATATPAQWSNNIPDKIRIKGRMYEFKSGSGYTAVAHLGKDIDNTLYDSSFDTTGKRYAVGKQGDTTAQANYYKPTTAEWDKVNKIGGTGTAIAHAGSGDDTNWAANDYVQLGAGASQKFYQATSQWDPANAANPAADQLFSLDTSNVGGANGFGKLWVQDAYIQDTQGGAKDFFKASNQWNSVGNHTGAATVNSWASGTVVHNSGGDNKFYQAKGDFRDSGSGGALAAHSASTLYKQFDPGTTPSHVTNSTQLGERVVENGTGNSFYSAGAYWANTSLHTQGTGVTAFDSTIGSGNPSFAKVGNDFFRAVLDYSTMTHDKSLNHNAGTVIYDSGSQKYFEALSQVANYTSGTTTLSYANTNSATANQRALHQNGAASKVYVAQNALPAIATHSTTPAIKYAQSDIVNIGTEYKVATNLWNAVQNHTTGNAPTVGASVIVHNSADNTFYESQGNLAGGINNWSDTTFTTGTTFGDTIKSGASYYTPKYNISSSFTPGANNSANNVVKESASNHFQFKVNYHGSWAGGSIPANELVYIAADNAIYQNTSGAGNTSDPTGGGVAGWTNLGADLQTVNGHGNNAGNALLQKYTTSDPATATDWWDDVTAAVTLTTPSHARIANYWANATATVGTGTGYWTTTTDPQDLTNTTYWLEQSEGTDPNAGSIPGGSSAIWQEVTDKAKLSNGNRPASGVNNNFWENVTTAATTLTGAGSSTNWWNDVSSDLADPDGSASANVFWDDVSGPAGDTIFNFSNVGTGGTLANSYWSSATAELTDPAFSAGAPSTSWWTDVDSDMTDMTSSSATTSNFWTNVTSELTSNDTGNAATFSQYWDEIGHANRHDDLDTNFWQLIKPGMKRFNPNGTAGVVAAATDYSIWSKIGNVKGYSGNNATFGDHDANESALGNSAVISNWTTGSYAADQIVMGSDNNFYRSLAAGTTTDPTTAAGGNEWDLVATNINDARKVYYTDTDYWDQVSVDTPADSSPYWEVMRETVIKSSQSLGTVDLTVSIASSNLNGWAGSATSGLASGKGAFFIGEAEGAVRIDYDVNNDTVAALINRVNSSEANVHMYYDPVGDRFVVRNKEPGAIGITLHEATSFDKLSANTGVGDMLKLMGLAAPNSATDFTAYTGGHNNGDYIQYTVGAETTYWQAIPGTGSVTTSTPSTSSTEWRQVIQGVGRVIRDELGSNSRVTVNDSLVSIYSPTTSFDDTTHGYKGITFDISRMSIGETANFTVAKDTTAAKKSIDKFVEEYNDAQDYIRSLTAVTNDGDNVSAGRFSSNIEISRLGSQLRKVIFGDSTPHSASERTSDGADLVISSQTETSLANINANANSELNKIKTELSLNASNDGYLVRAVNDSNTNASGEPQLYYKYDHASTSWVNASPAYSSFRMADIGLDFGIGSDRLLVKNSALLIQELDKRPEKVQALFAEAKVESTKTAIANDLSSNPKTLNNKNPNSPTATNAGVGDLIANVAAYDANSSSYRTFQGLSYALDDFISAFLTGDSETGYKGAYQAHIDSVKSQNKRIDDRIEDLERYIEQREKTLSEGFMRMEEMQSQLNTQLQTLQNSFKSK